MKELSNCEKMILACIYKHIKANKEAPNVHDIEAILKNDYCTEWVLQTLCTFLNRMKVKGYLLTEKNGRYTLYTPALDYEEYMCRELRNISYLYFGSDMNKLANYINYNF